MSDSVDLDLVLKRANAALRIVYDSETTGLDWKRHTVCGHVLTFGPKDEDTFYVPVRHAADNIGHVKRFEKALFKAMEGKHLVGHSMKFDAHMVRSTGYDLTKIAATLECTLVNQSLINELQGKFSLDDCCAAMGVPMKDTRVYAHLAHMFGGEPDRKQMANFWKLSGEDDVGVAYARADGVATWALREAQHVELENQKLMRVWALERRVLRTLIRMEKTGVRVNEDALTELRKRLMDEVEETLAEMPKDFNVRSAKQLSELFLSQGHDPTHWPKTAPSKRFPDGQYSFTESWLSQFPLGERIVRVRKFTNIINSFIDPLRERHLFNWRVHTNFNQIKMDDYGVVSGRLSSSDPNMQQVPKHDELLAPLFRQCFEPDEGYYWCSNDYKQQEFVVFACYSETQALIDGYCQDPPVDVHQTVANLMHVDRNTKAKRLNLGKLYGMGVEKLAASLGVPFAEAQKLSKAWEQIIPTAPAFRKTCEDVVKRRAREGDGYITTFSGRKRRYPGAQNAHAAMSGLIQGSCADICKDKMCEVDEYFESEGDEKAQLLLQVHDSLDWQTMEGEDRLDVEAQRIMQDFDRPPYKRTINGCPMRIDVGVGKNWKEASFGIESHGHEHNQVNTQHLVGKEVTRKLKKGAKK